MIEDLTMLANLPVADAEVAARAKAEVDKAAAAETLPPATCPEAAADEPDTRRLARRGQDPPGQEHAAEEDS